MVPTFLHRTFYVLVFNHEATPSNLESEGCGLIRKLVKVVLDQGSVCIVIKMSSSAKWFLNKEDDGVINLCTYTLESATSNDKVNKPEIVKDINCLKKNSMLKSMALRV